MIQRNFRRYVAVRITNELSQQRDSAIVIQSTFRRFIAHEKFLDYRYFIIEMQRTFRGYITRKELKAKDYAALVIQQVWWSYVAEVEMEIAAICLQKTWRGVLGRRKWIEQATYRDAASVIQKVWRGYNQSLVYSITLHSAIVLQKMMRGFLGRKAISVNRYRNAATSIQKLWRGFSVQVQYQIDIFDIVCVQSLVRRFLSKRDLKKRTNALSILQCAYRCSVARDQMAVKIQDRMEERLRFRSAVIIQAHVRTLIARQSDKRLSFAATLIQSAWRRYWVYTDYTIYVNEINSATLIQAHVRRMATMRMIDTQNSSARTIQLHWLKYKQFKLETNSATKVQAFIRSKLSRLRFLEMKSASIVVQQMARARQARNILSIKQKQRQFEQSAITLQRVWRGFSVQVQYQMDVFDIICVQSIARRYSVSRAYKRGIVALSTIQRAFRCAAARRERALRKLVLDTLVVESSIKIQTAVRGLVSRSKFLMMKAASIDIQKNFRGHVVRNHLDSAAQNATVIQSNWRMYQLTKNYKAFLVSATKIQACFRLHSKQSKYLGMKEAAVCIQRCWRGSASRDHLSKQYRACTMIQSNWRRSFAQNNYLLDLLEIKCATVIQSSFRMYMHRMDYLVIKYSAQTIQRFTRGLLSRVDLKIKNFAAAEIQRIWRGHCTCSMKSMVHGAVKIQSVTRMTSAKKKVDALRILQWAENRNRNKNASIIQDSFRKYTLRKQRENAAKIIQTSFRSYSELKRIQRGSHGVIALQSRFRGAQVRKKRSKRLFELERRIQKETKRALLNPTLRLGYRTSRALEILQTSQSLTKIMAAVKELESSTRLSVVCCQVFTKANAANILLYLIQSCNRSVPHMELKEHILLTLENVAQYSSLVGSFAHYKYAEVFLDNVQVFRDKDGIFCLAVMLLGRITQADKDVAQFCATHEHLKRLKEVYRVASRRRIKSEKNKVISEKARRLRKYGLAKRDDFDRKSATRLLREMIDSFSEIEVPHITKTPSGQGKGFNWNELLYSPLI
jgi:myosin heavy subunit